jgi:hypothetical protein
MLKIRAGEVDFQELHDRYQKQVEEIDAALRGVSTLRDRCDETALTEWLLNIRLSHIPRKNRRCNSLFYTSSTSLSPIHSFVCLFPFLGWFE